MCLGPDPDRNTTHGRDTMCMEGPGTKTACGQSNHRSSFASPLSDIGILFVLLQNVFLFTVPQPLTNTKLLFETHKSVPWVKNCRWTVGQKHCSKIIKSPGTCGCIPAIKLWCWAVNTDLV